jgi:hypothetical protein
LKEKFDNKSIYCRKLGHYLRFNYCRREKEGLPCRKIVDCWFEKFNIGHYLHDCFKEDEIMYIFEPPQAKVATLVELIKQAQQPNT